VPGESDPSPSLRSGLRLLRGGVTIDGMAPGDRGGRPYIFTPSRKSAVRLILSLTCIEYSILYRFSLCPFAKSAESLE